MPRQRPLLVTSDPALLDELLRLTSAVGVEADVVPDAGAAGRRWSSAPLVVVAGPSAAGVLLRGAAPRSGVVVVVTDPDDDGWEAALAAGAAAVLTLPDDEDELARRLADAVVGATAAAVVGVVGGRGGAGGSTAAVALALAGVRAGFKTLLLDADPMGGGIDLLLGAEDAAGLRWTDLAGARGLVSGAALTDVLPEPHGLHVLSWDRGALPAVPPEAMRTVLDAARGDHDLVVVDLPRYVDEATALALRACEFVLLLVPAEVRAVASAARVVLAVEQHTADVRCVVREVAASALDAVTVADALDLPLAASLAPEPGLASALERGEPPGRRARSPLGRFCAGVVAVRLGPGVAA